LFPEYYFGVGNDPFEKLAMLLFNQCRTETEFKTLGDLQALNRINLGDGFKFVIDEAQLLSKAFPNQFASHDVTHKSLRPLLSPFLQGVYKVTSMSAVIAGTGLSLLDEQKSIGSAQGVRERINVYTTFPPLIMDGVKEFLSEILHDSNKMELVMAAAWLMGRPRWSTLFITNLLLLNKTIGEHLFEFVNEMTKVFTEEKHLVPRSPSDSIAVLAEGKHYLDRKKEITNPLNKLLRNTFLISIGYPPQPVEYTEYLALGLGSVKEAPKSAALDFKLIGQILPESLVLEAARKYIAPRKKELGTDSLTSVQHDSAALGKNWEFVVANGFGDYLPGLLKEINEIPDAPLAFKKDWNLFPPNFGRVGHPNGVEPEGFFEWQEWCFQHMHLQSGQNISLSAPASAASTTTSTKTTCFEINPLRCSKLDKKEKNGELNEENENPTELLTLPPFSMCLTANKAGPDLCFVLHADKVNSIMFVFIQVKLAEDFDFKEAAQTVDPSLFYFSNRGDAKKEMWIKKYSENLIRWMTNLVLDDIPVVRMVISGADSDDKEPEVKLKKREGKYIPKTQILPIDREHILKKFLLYKYRETVEPDLPKTSEEIDKMTVAQLKSVLSRCKEPFKAHEKLEDLKNNLKRNFYKIQKIKENSLGAASAGSSTSGEVEKEKPITDAETEGVDELFKKLVEKDLRWDSYSSKKIEGKLVGKDVLIYLDHTNTATIIGESLADVTNMLKESSSNQ
jgi:hypothetical protein